MSDAISTMSEAVSAAAPFVKWAGGKSRLTRLIEERLVIGGEHRRYFEPFVGAGAVFFRMRRRYPELECRIADLNPDLIRCYRVVRDDVEGLLEHLERHANEHSEAHYYRVRKSSQGSDVERAARFIYLNRTCYNGLYRVNRSGQFNVPMGRYKNPSIVQRERLVAASIVLANTVVEVEDFEASVGDAGPGDLVYLDPPYDPVSRTSDFTAYTPGGFGHTGQRRLARVFERLTQRGAHVVLSNSDTEFVRELYENIEPRPSIDRVTVTRAINSNAARRGAVGEVLIYSPHGGKGPGGGTV